MSPDWLIIVVIEKISPESEFWNTMIKTIDVRIDLIAVRDWSDVRGDQACRRLSSWNICVSKGGTQAVGFYCQMRAVSPRISSIRVIVSPCQEQYCSSCHIDGLLRGESFHASNHLTFLEWNYGPLAQSIRSGVPYASITSTLQHMLSPSSV